MASTAPLMIQSKIEFLQDPEYDGDIHDPSLGLLSKLPSNDHLREEQGEEDCLLLDQASSQVVTTVPAITCDDPATWTNVVNTRKEKKAPQNHRGFSAYKNKEYQSHYKFRKTSFLNHKS